MNHASAFIGQMNADMAIHVGQKIGMKLVIVSNNEYPRGNNLKTCIICSKEYKIYPYEKDSRKHCSRTCYYEIKKLQGLSYVGKTFGKTTIIEFIGLKERTDGHTVLRFKGQCACGNVRTVSDAYLKDERVHQCRPCSNNYRCTIEIGRVYGKWLVLERTDGYFDERKQAYSHRQFKCKCICGKITSIKGSTLQSGKSTGCRQCSSGICVTKHNLSRSKTYRGWRSMIDRCNNPKTRGFEFYGGRGIKICNRWIKFESFVEDMGIKPEGHRIALDRIDPDGNYEPGNCRWVTTKENNNNKRNSKKNKHIYLYIKKDKLCDTCKELK